LVQINQYKEVKEGQRHNPKHKIKSKKQKMTTKMAQEILAMALGTSQGDLASDEMTLQQLNPNDMPLSSSALQEYKKLMVVLERKRKKRKLPFTKIVRKRKKSSKFD
jgi:hypothetical protein